VSVLFFGLSNSTASKEAVSPSDGIKAFVEACVLGAPDFKKSNSIFQRRGIPIVPYLNTTTEVVTANRTLVHAIRGRTSYGNLGDACGVIIRGNHESVARTYITKYLDTPDFPFALQESKRGIFGLRQRSSFARVYQTVDGRLLEITIQQTEPLANERNATLILATVNKRNKR
jgi:hypothetical protein